MRTSGWEFCNFLKINQFGPWQFFENQSIWSLTILCKSINWSMLAWHLMW